MTTKPNLCLAPLGEICLTQKEYTAQTHCTPPNHHKSNKCTQGCKIKKSLYIKNPFRPSTCTSILLINDWGTSYVGSSVLTANHHRNLTLNLKQLGLYSSPLFFLTTNQYRLQKLAFFLPSNFPLQSTMCSSSFFCCFLKQGVTFCWTTTKSAILPHNCKHNGVTTTEHFCSLF